MAYNLYQVQMAKAWAERIEKENTSAEKFWYQHSLKGGSSPASPGVNSAAPPPVAPYYGGDGASMAGSLARSGAPTGYTSKTSALRSRMERLEQELIAERECRKKAEEDLTSLRNSIRR